MNKNNEITSDDAVVNLVKAAKHRPLPRSSKVLFLVVVTALVFTGGIAYGKYKATVPAGGGLTLSALGGGGGFGNFGGGRFRDSGGNAAAPGASGAPAFGADGSGAPAGGTATPTDVAGTVVSVSSTQIVIQTLSGSNETFPVAPTTRVRTSSVIPLKGVKTGDIVTIKPDPANNAQTIMVVK